MVFQLDQTQADDSFFCYPEARILELVSACSLYLSRHGRLLLSCRIYVLTHHPRHYPRMSLTGYIFLFIEIFLQERKRERERERERKTELRAGCLLIRLPMLDVLPNSGGHSCSTPSLSCNTPMVSRLRPAYRTCTHPKPVLAGQRHIIPNLPDRQFLLRADEVSGLFLHLERAPKNAPVRHLCLCKFILKDHPRNTEKREHMRSSLYTLHFLHGLNYRPTCTYYCREV